MYRLVFDEVILKQLKKAGKAKDIKLILTKMLDRIEELGQDAGKLLDPKLCLYEVKSKRPPIRLYFKIVEQSREALVFEYEMKTSQKKQNKTIGKLTKKIIGQKPRSER